MGIDIGQLPPWAQKQILNKLVSQQPLLSSPQKEGKAKYHNEKATRDGLKFDSKKEAERFDALMLLLKAGAIQDLRLQRDFTLQESYTLPNGKRVRAIRYRADFTYVQEGKLIVEDVKSKATKTREYEIKKKLIREKYGVEIVEV